MASLKLSVLDQSPVPAGARPEDALGYTSYWLAEHHNTRGLAGPAPEVMVATVAAATDRIRVGSGGVMLPHYAPLKVAEQFKVLEALHPGRIDLGIGRAPGTDQMTALALRRSRQAMFADDLPDQLGELLAAAGSRPWPDEHPFRHVRAAPVEAPLPPVYLLGPS